MAVLQAGDVVNPIVTEVAPKKPPTDGLSSMQSLLATVVIAVFVITFVVQAFQIPSESMENTLLIGDYLLVDKLRYGDGGFWDPLMPYRRVRRGDIIVCETCGRRSRRPGPPDQSTCVRKWRSYGRSLCAFQFSGA
jgi:hypothetical protein